MAVWSFITEKDKNVNTAPLAQTRNSWRTAFLFCGFFFSVFFCIPAHSRPYTLAQAWVALQAQEPGYLSALYRQQAAHARIQLAQSRFRPQILLNASKRFTSRSYETSGGSARAETRQDYVTDSARVQVTQSLFRKADRLGIERARLTHQQLQQQRLHTLQELSNRLVVAWLDLSRARDSMVLGRRQQVFYQHLLQSREQSWQAGLAARPVVEKARAEWHLSTSQLKVAQAEFEQHRATLEAMTGGIPDMQLPALKVGQLQHLGKGQKLADWLKRVEATNHGIQAADYEARVARLEQQQKHAARLPTVDLQAAYDWGRQGAGSTPSQSGYRNGQVQLGLLFSVPLYTGGAYDAGVAEAAATVSSLDARREQVRREAVTQARQSWHSAQSARQKLLAAQAQLEAAHWSIRQAEQGLENGLKTQDDVIQAHQEQHIAQQQALEARYAYIAAWYRVRSLAQFDRHALIAQVNALFE